MSDLPYPFNHEQATYPTLLDGGMPPAAWVSNRNRTPIAYYYDGQSGKPDMGNPVTLSPTQRRRHLVDIAPTGGGKTTMQVERAVGDHFASHGPVFYFCGPGRRTVPEDVIAAMLCMPDIAADDIADHVEVIPLGSIVPGLTFADLRKYTEAERDRTIRRGIEGEGDEIRRRAIENLRDHFAEYVRVAAQDPPEDQHSRPLYQLLHLAPEIAFDSSWRELDVVPPRDQYEVCPVSDFVTIMQRVAHYVRTEQIDKLPLGELDLQAANQHLGNLLEYSPEAFGNIVAGATTRIMTLLKHSVIQQMLDNTNAKFSIKELIKNKKLYIFDTSGLARPVQPLATLTFLNELYLATNQLGHQLADTSDKHVINVLLDEAPRMLGFEPVQEWMAEARNNDIGLDFTLQTEQQYREVGQEHLIEEQRTNFGTILIRSPSPDETLAQMFRREEMDIDKTMRRLRDIYKFTRIMIAERYRGDPGRRGRIEPQKVAYYVNGPPDWRDDSEWRTSEATTPNPWPDHLPADARYETTTDDPYPFAEDDLDTAIADVMEQSQARFGLTQAEQRVIRTGGQWLVPPALQEQYGLQPEAIATAVAIATEHERRTGRFYQQSTATGTVTDPSADTGEEMGTTREWVSQANVITRLQYWQRMGPLAGHGDDEEGAAAETEEAAAAAPATPGASTVPTSAEDWATVIEQLPTVTHQADPPEQVTWPDDASAYAKAGVVALTEHGKRQVGAHDTPGTGPKAGGKSHTRLLERGLAPFRQLSFEGGVVTQQEGAPQPDARLFLPELPEIHLEAEYQTLEHPAQLGGDLARIQDADAFPVFLAPIVGPDDDRTRSPAYWAEQVWDHYVDPVRDHTDDGVEYYVHRNRTVDFNGGAEAGGWTAARPIPATDAVATSTSPTASAGETASNATDDQEGDPATGAEPEATRASEPASEDDTEPTAETGSEPDRDAASGPETESDAPAAADTDTDPVTGGGAAVGTASGPAGQTDPRRQTRWFHDGDAYVLKDGTGRAYARLGGFTAPRPGAFPARYRNTAAGDDDAPDEYEVQMRSDDSKWTTVDTYDSTDALTEDFVPVKEPFVPEADLAHPTAPTGAAVLLVETDSDTPAKEATVKWYDGRRRATDADELRPITDLVGALSAGVLTPASGEWASHTEPPTPPSGGAPATASKTEGEAAAAAESDGEGEDASESKSKAELVADSAVGVEAAREQATALPAPAAEADATAVPTEADASDLVPDSVQQQLDEFAEAVREDEPTVPPARVRLLRDRVDDRIDPTAYEINPEVVVAVFANTSLTIFPRDETPDDKEVVAQPRDDVRTIYDDWFEPFLELMPVNATIPYTMFRDTIDDLFPAVDVLNLKIGDVFEGAERANDRPDRDVAAKHLGVAAYVDDAVSVEYTAQAAYSVAREQCAEFARALGLVPNTALGEDTPLYEPNNFKRLLEWYVGHVVFPGPADTAPIETAQVYDRSLPERYTDNQGRLRCCAHLKLTSTSTTVPEDPPAQPDA